MLRQVSRLTNRSPLHMQRSLARKFCTSGSSRPDTAPPASLRKSWIPRSDEQLQKVTTQSLILEVIEQQRETTTKIVPWFLSNMPRSYFRQIPEELQMQHVKTAAAIRQLGQSDLSLKIRSSGATEGTSLLTYMSTKDTPGLLNSQINDLVVPDDHQLSNVKVFSSFDGELTLNIFSFQNMKLNGKLSATEEDAAKILAFAADLKAGKFASLADEKHTNKYVPAYTDELFSEEKMKEYITYITPSYARQSEPRRFMIQREMYKKVCDNDGTEVRVEAYEPSQAPGSATTAKPRYWLTIASANVLPDVLLRLCSAIISARGLDVSRAYLDSIKSPHNSTPELGGNVTVLDLLISGPADHPELDLGSEKIQTLKRDLKRAKWLDDATTRLGIYAQPSYPDQLLGLDKAEVITALCSMLHGPLAKESSSGQTFLGLSSLLQTLGSHWRYMSIADSIAQLFLQKFDVEAAAAGKLISKAEYNERESALAQTISSLTNETARSLLRKMLQAVRATLRTNFYNPDRYALSLRLDPLIMMTASEMDPANAKPVPFGVFFSHGRHFNAFHCRFKDIARGGMRLVTPPNSDQYALESARQFDEVYGLSYGQQLKNKDIPEGGAKAVLLINPSGVTANTKFFAMRKAVKAFGDSILDLVVRGSVDHLVDYYEGKNKHELIYLGPDEQIIPSDIEWLIHRAGQRGYPIPAAFMSSKKDDGINHKEYGVTSEGVVVYLDVALNHILKIDPYKQPFTIKITGGPDGDVAGNLIRILYREYGENCKVVGIADGFGVAEDPNGLDITELLRLVKESLPITSFDAAKLSDSPDSILLESSTEEGMKRRNSMCFRVKSDAFVPAGGRPNTINGENWESFLLPAAPGAAPTDRRTPSSPLIVEGANIFITKDARHNLFEHGGVTIVKDSSANKCGVITSSFEIAGSMLMTKEEFIREKPALVEDVLQRLRHVARLEGTLLFREYSNYPGALPNFSERISFAINMVKDAVTEALDDVDPQDPLFQELRPLILENLPTKLAEYALRSDLPPRIASSATSSDRLSACLPVQYQRNAIATALASKVVYKEGIHVVEQQPKEMLARRAIAYYREEVRVQKLVQVFEREMLRRGLAGEGVRVSEGLHEGGSDEEDAEEGRLAVQKMKEIVLRGGARTELLIF